MNIGIARTFLPLLKQSFSFHAIKIFVGDRYQNLLIYKATTHKLSDLSDTDKLDDSSKWEHVSSFYSNSQACAFLHLLNEATIQQPANLTSNKQYDGLCTDSNFRYGFEIIEGVRSRGGLIALGADPENNLLKTGKIMVSVRDYYQPSHIHYLSMSGECDDVGLSRALSKMTEMSERDYPNPKNKENICSFEYEGRIYGNIRWSTGKGNMRVWGDAIDGFDYTPPFEEREDGQRVDIDYHNKYLFWQTKGTAYFVHGNLFYNGKLITTINDIVARIALTDEEREKKKYMFCHGCASNDKDIIKEIKKIVPDVESIEVAGSWAEC